MNAKMDATQEKMNETMEKQIGSLVYIMEADRKTDREEMKQEIRATKNICKR
jgi:hypothetical protein